MRKLLLSVLAALLALAAIVFFFAVSPFVDGRLNRVDATQAIAVGERAAALHATLRIADLHDDLLLWDRSVLGPSTRGHTDVARLEAGNVAVQVFSTVTKTPRGQNYDKNSAETDNITLLAIASRWPVRTWGSLLQRALHEGTRLDRAAARSEGRLLLARSRAEFEQALATRAAATGAEKPVIGLLSTEGLQAIVGRIENLDTLFAHGFRLAGLAHFFDNEVAGSAHGEAKGGLTPLGRQVVRRMEERRMIVDLAHVSPAAFDEVLAMAARPVVVSHTGVRFTCPGPRNLSDAQLDALGKRGALVGIGFWDGAVCDPSPRVIAASIQHAVNVAGAEHVALGSDWDGATTVAVPADRLAQVTQALLDLGMPEPVIRQVMGENAIRFFRENLP
jgi:microsomal dipeptidase-like Zn-dependent dipeptidase